MTHSVSPVTMLLISFRTVRECVNVKELVLKPLPVSLNFQVTTRKYKLRLDFAPRKVIRRENVTIFLSRGRSLYARLPRTKTR